MIQKLFVDTSIRALYGVFTVWKMLRRSGVRPARLFTIKNRTRRTERNASRRFELGLWVCNIPGRPKNMQLRWLFVSNFSGCPRTPPVLWLNILVARQGLFVGAETPGLGSKLVSPSWYVSFPR